MISKELKAKQSKQLLIEEITKMLNQDKGSFLKIQDVQDFTKLLKVKMKDPKEDIRFFDIEDSQIEEITKLVLKDNDSVKLYLSNVKHITVNDFLDIEKNKYILYMAKIHDIIDNSRIEEIYLKMPIKIKKSYAMKKVNKEAFNKHVRFAK
jgi:hypothetical protein